MREHARVVKNAIVSTIGTRNVKTADIGGTASTSEFMKHVVEEIQIHTPEIGHQAANQSSN